MTISSKSYTATFAVLFTLLLYTLTRILKPIVSIRYPFPHPATVFFMTNFYCFNRLKANLRLGYKPIYKPEESMANSLEYYTKIVLWCNGYNNRFYFVVLCVETVILLEYIMWGAIFLVIVNDWLIYSLIQKWTTGLHTVVIVLNLNLGFKHFLQLLILLWESVYEWVRNKYRDLERSGEM